LDAAAATTGFAIVRSRGLGLGSLGVLSEGICFAVWSLDGGVFRSSARPTGLEEGQTDPGFVFISVLQKLGLAWDVKQPGDEAERQGLIRVQ
jgi:stearoyl-CoA desaturase (delta-9 desaturase)